MTPPTKTLLNAPTSPKWPYVLATCVILTIAMLVIGAIVVMRPKEDNTTIITIIAAMIAPTLTAIVALLKGVESSDAVKELHVAVDGRLTQLLERTAQAERLVGRLTGRDEGEAKAIAQASSITDLVERTATAAVRTAEVATEVSRAAANAPAIMPPAPPEEL